MPRVYLDHNATTPLDPRVLEAMSRMKTAILVLAAAVVLTAGAAGQLDQAYQPESGQRQPIGF